MTNKKVRLNVIEQSIVELLRDMTEGELAILSDTIFSKSKECGEMFLSSKYFENLAKLLYEYKKEI